MLPPDPQEQDLVEVVPIQSEDTFFDVGDPAADPTPVPSGEGGPPSAPPPEGTPPLPPPSDAPQLPDWLAEIAAPERAQVLSDALARMPASDLAQLAPVQQLLGAQHQLTAAAVQNQQYEQSQVQQRQNYMAQHTAAFVDSLSAWAPSDVDLRGEANQLAQVVQSAYHDDITGRIEQGLLRGLARVGLGPNNLPPTLIARVNAAPDYGGVVQAYLDATAEAAFELGKIKSRSDNGESLKAESIAAKARAKNEALGELAKEGRIRLQQDGDGFLASLLDQVPPSLSGTPVASGPSEIDEAEFNEAMSDPDAYDRLMKDPVKAAALHKLMAGAMAT